MGTWSLHPMGNDNALNARDVFFRSVLPDGVDIFEDREKVKKRWNHFPTIIFVLTKTF